MADFLWIPMLFLGGLGAVLILCFVIACIDWLFGYRGDDPI